MKILVISGYAAWYKVSKGLMPSHHLFGVHELIDHYEPIKGSIRGILKKDSLGGGYVDFYIWRSGKKNIISQIKELVSLSKEYDVIYDQLNRCSIYLGALNKIGILKCKLITILHHPPYDIQLRISDSDAYIFFNEDYKNLAIRANPKMANRFFVNEWLPDSEWYRRIIESNPPVKGTTFYIDTGKSKRDRETLRIAANKTEIRVDYAGDNDETIGWARSYCVDLKDDIKAIRRIREYKAVIIPVLQNTKYKVGPLGITSFLDCIALGIPVIASDNVCFANEVKEYQLGLLYQTGNADSLADAMEKLYKSKDFYQLCCNNMIAYGKKTINDYSATLVNIIHAIF